jgi:hypothetical protein
MQGQWISIGDQHVVRGKISKISILGIVVYNCATVQVYCTYPAHHNKHAGGEVDAEQEGAQGPGQDDLQPKHTVVA